MDIKPLKVSVRDLVEDYEDLAEAGVVGYSGGLDIRPPYQREFIYGEKDRNAVIDTLTRGFPLNVMYWAVRADGGYEIIDGQQRTISICQYVDGEFAVDGRYFHNLQNDEQEQILGYELMVYLCSGTDSEKLEWFRIINIAGKQLTEQELRNAVYSGSWTAAAKPYFSKTNCPAYVIGGDYMQGTAIRQDYLETVLDWISQGEIEAYMAAHQHDANANELRLYFENVMAWVKVTFPEHRREMKSVHWGPLYDQYGTAALDPVKLEEQVKELMIDDDVGSNSGIYSFVLDGDERHLNLRAFSAAQKRAAYEEQGHLCANGDHCKTPGNDDGTQTFDIEEMEADHITPWSKGGKTEPDNCQMLCLPCNRDKSGL